MTDPTTEAFDAGTAAIQTAAEAAAAQELARAADTAALLAHVDDRLKEYNKQNMSTIATSMVDVVNDALGKFPTRYFDASRIPLICQSILAIHEDVKQLSDMMKTDREAAGTEHEKFVTKESFYPVRNIIYGMVGLVLTAFMTGLIILVFRTQ